MNNEATNNGGVFHLKQLENTVIEKNIFKENKANNGGTLFLEENKNISIFDNLF